MTRLALPFLLLAALPLSAADQPPPVLRSAKSGPWSDGTTWEGGKVPGPLARVQVRTGHTVVYDGTSADVIRSIHVAGTLTFVPDKDTVLNVGLVKIQPGDDAAEDGFDCDAHVEAPKPGQVRPALLVGTPERPIDAKHTATIRLHPVTGLDPQSCPAIVCCGGRMDFHGAPMSRTWLKLGATAKKGDTDITLAEAVTGWKVGDRVILTATTRQIKVQKTFRESVKDSTQTEERLIKAVAGTKLTLDKPLDFDHAGTADYRGDVANLSRNVVVESAKPDTDGARGHTMYHRGSAGSVSYAEFRKLGKPGVLGRYSLHFHLCGDTMRGSSVTGASVWGSGNRWLTIHGTNYLVARDCVGYQSLGHGYFLEDGTEVFNVFDRNLAVQAYTTKPLPKQVLPFDKNDGSGFWWANSLNTFTRNVAAECDEYGYFFQAPKTKEFDPVLRVLTGDGTRKEVDVRTLPFVRFEDNEAHCQRRHAFNLGGGVPFGEPTVGGVGPDAKHPFVIRNYAARNVHWAIHPVSPSVLLTGLEIRNAAYGIWRPVYTRHAHESVTITDATVPFAFETSARPKLGDVAPLEPTDDLPPVTVITHASHLGGGKWAVRGTTSDNGEVTTVTVNGVKAKAVRPNFAEWELTLDGLRPGDRKLTAGAVDKAGNAEKRPHEVNIPDGR